MDRIIMCFGMATLLLGAFQVVEDRGKGMTEATRRALAFILLAYIVFLVFPLPRPLGVFGLFLEVVFGVPLLLLGMMFIVVFLTMFIIMPVFDFIESHDSVKMAIVSAVIIGTIVLVFLRLVS